MAGENQKLFERVAGNVALDLVNTLDFRFRESGPEELLVGYDDLLALVTQAGLITRSEAGILRRTLGKEGERLQVLERVREFREALSVTLYTLADQGSPPASALVRLEREFTDGFRSRSLVVDEGAVRWKPRAHVDLATPLDRLVMEAERLLLSEQIAWIRYCASDTCRWLFLDTSKSPHAALVRYEAVRKSDEGAKVPRPFDWVQGPRRSVASLLPTP